MTPRPSSHGSNPVVGLLHCQCGKLMKVRRRSVGHRGRCKRCGRTLVADEDRLSPLPAHLQAKLDRAEPSAEVDYPPPDDELDAPPFDEAGSQWSAEVDEPRAPSVLAGPEEAAGAAAPRGDTSDWDDADGLWAPEEDSDSEEAPTDSERVASGFGGGAADERAISDPVSGVREPAKDWAPDEEDPATAEAAPTEVTHDWADERAERSGPDWRFSDEPDSEEPWAGGPDRGGAEDDSESPARGTSWDAVAPGEAVGDSTGPDASQEDWMTDDPGGTWDGVAPPRGHERGHGTDAGADVAAAGLSWDSQTPGLEAADSLASPTAWDGIAPDSSARIRPDAAALSHPDLPESGADPAAASVGETQLPTGDTLSDWFEREDDRYQGEGDHAGPPVEAWQRRRQHRHSSHGRGSGPGRPQGGQPGAVGKHRIAWMVFPLSMLTLGVYYYVWIWKIFSELRDHLVRERYLSPVIAVVFHFVPVLGFIWPNYILFRAARDVNVLQDLEGRDRTANPIAVLTGTILALMLPVVGLGLLANELTYGIGGLAAAPLLWWWATAKVQAALNAHWRLHAQ